MVYSYRKIDLQLIARWSTINKLNKIAIFLANKLKCFVIEVGF